tara:strand:+ start:944 stop:1126 length:183 start_codon:yes stop_codon:yes gene_type:complete
MENQDSLDRTAHAYGMTDLEIEEKEAVLAEIDSQQVIRRRMEEEQDALKLFDEEEFPYLF